MNTLPPWLCNGEALMCLIGFNAQQVRRGGFQQGAATRQGPRHVGDLCPDRLGEETMRLNVRYLEALFQSVI